MGLVQLPVGVPMVGAALGIAAVGLGVVGAAVVGGAGVGVAVGDSVVGAGVVGVCSKPKAEVIIVWLQMLFRIRRRPCQSSLWGASVHITGSRSQPHTIRPRNE